VAEEVDEAIYEAIVEGARAGVHRCAARLNPKSARTWEGFAELHSEKVRALLGEAMDRLDVDDAGPCPRCQR
jgi:hypothetical protein